MSLSYYLAKIRGGHAEFISQPPAHAPGHLASSLGLSSLAQTLGVLSHSYVGSSLKLLVLGSIVETGRRIFMWLIERFGIQYCTTMRFSQGDPAYEWIVLFLTQENVWRRSREFTVSANNSRRKWAVRAASDATVKANAEYVPLYRQPQLFRWRGYWVEIKRTGADAGPHAMQGPYAYAGHEGSSIDITVYTLNMNVLSDLVEDARLRYLEVNRPNVVIYLTDSPQFSHHQTAWATVKHKIRRPLNSIILPPHLLDSLVSDATEFLNTENWYNEAGIPHRRGYLLYGPPGTGKTSTIYALAGALNLEIYSLSLASNFVDDSYLQRAASAIPKHGLFLIEDIDCAFPSREDEEEEDANAGAAGGAAMAAMMMQVARRRGAGSKVRRSLVTLSGLLNVIDGIGSEEGKLFFATTNHIDRLDAALLRPGRIDRKVQYDLATASQARALFVRFFPAWRFPDPQPQDEGGAHGLEVPLHMQQELAGAKMQNGEEVKPVNGATNEGEKEEDITIARLADVFAAHIPPGEFSTAELQGYLQGHKARPRAAAGGVSGWVESVREERQAGERRKEERRARVRARREGAGAGAGIGVSVPGMGVPGMGVQEMGMGMGMGMGMQTQGAGLPGTGVAGMGVGAVPGLGAGGAVLGVVGPVLAVNGGNTELVVVAAETLPNGTQTNGVANGGEGIPEAENLKPVNGVYTAVDSEEDAGDEAEAEAEVGGAEAEARASKKATLVDGFTAQLDSDPEALKVREWRHKLQKTFLNSKSLPPDEDMPQVDSVFSNVEGYQNMNIEYLRYSKIEKVMRHISLLESGKVPRDDEFKFRYRAKVLVDKWQGILDGSAAVTERDGTINSDEASST
ncbi:hypothetical protein DFH06DRAFT_1465587 [Mycena polygramma]|nr:hypothetical protein DFH06DRAFT_1465587 [Mycena polygramma]